jgi:CheY-like chemotaxis protein
MVSDKKDSKDVPKDDLKVGPKDDQLANNNVLLVTEHRAFKDVITDNLNSKGYNVFFTENAEEALMILVSQRAGLGPFDEYGMLTSVDGLDGVTLASDLPYVQKKNNDGNDIYTKPGSASINRDDSKIMTNRGIPFSLMITSDYLPPTYDPNIQGVQVGAVFDPEIFVDNRRLEDYLPDGFKSTGVHRGLLLLQEMQNISDRLKAKGEGQPFEGLGIIVHGHPLLEPVAERFGAIYMGTDINTMDDIIRRGPGKYRSWKLDQEISRYLDQK